MHQLGITSVQDANANKQCTTYSNSSVCSWRDGRRTLEAPQGRNKAHPQGSCSSFNETQNQESKKQVEASTKGKEEAEKKVEAKKAVPIPFYKAKSQVARAEWRSILQNLAWAKQVSHHQLRIHYNYPQLAILESNSVTACIIAGVYFFLSRKARKAMWKMSRSKDS